jgi:hypothetical protein
MYASALKIGVLALGLLLLTTCVAVPVPRASGAAAQLVTANPGYINLGMNTTINVTAPSAGTYTIVVQKPSGVQLQLNQTFESSGQSQNITFGNAISGIKGAVDQAGTYNVLLQQGATLVSSTTFIATAKLNVFMDMVNSGRCDYINGAPRGVKLLPRFYVTFASSGAPFTNNTKGAYVTYTLPDGTTINASWHKPNTISQTTAGFFIGKYQPNWNDTHVGPWNPTATFGDAAGNLGTYKYLGVPFVISPAQLSTGVQVTDVKTNQSAAGLYNGQSVDIVANVTYPTNAEPVPGFVSPLDTNVRGGIVTAYVGWGYFNSTSATFGGGKTTGAPIGKATLSYSTTSHLWTGLFNVSSLPTLPSGKTYEVVVVSSDKASPPNTGLMSINVASAIAAPSVNTSPSTGYTSSGSESGGASTASTTSSGSIPLWAYAGTTIALIVGVLVGFLARRPK